MSPFYFILFILTNIGASVKEVFRRDGDVNVALLLRSDCNRTTALTLEEQSLVNSAIWTVHQMNYSELLPNVTLGLYAYKTCDDKEEYQAIFELFQRREEEFLLGLISTSVTTQILKLCDALDLVVQSTVKCPAPLIKASVELLKTLQWLENVTLIAPNQMIVEEFSKISSKQSICVTKIIKYKSSIQLENSTNGYFVIFVNKYFKYFEATNIILVLLDDFPLNDLPENSYVIRTRHDEQSYYTPNPQLFEIAIPLVSYAENFKNLYNTCNDTNFSRCFKTNFRRQKVLEPSEIVDLLKIETSSINYYVYKWNNTFYHNQIYSYNIFNDNTTELVLEGNKTQKHCKNFLENGHMVPNYDIAVRTESWIFAFLSLSLLGVLFCIAILIFLLVSVCRRSVLEGNPVLTMLLLVTVMLMYCSILPLSLEGNQSAKNTICMARALAITLSFSAAFSLMLSRSILLVTASKEIGFMSHVAGPVQSFLCLFIFGVQAALSLQIINRCEDIFRGHSFIYLLSYNIILLLLLLCLCPLIVKCHRNYKEGKYFTLASIIISFLWCFWVPAYIFLDDYYKDSVLCFALVSTASALMATIFVPRTYLMTIAAARDKITSTLPSLASATSAMDIYRTGAQPVYDCVNVAAINAVTVARSVQQPDLYSSPNLPEDDFDFRCETPVADDKMTRF